MRFLIEDAEPGDGGRGPSTTGRPRGRSGHHGGRGRRGEGFGQGFGAGFGAGFGLARAGSARAVVAAAASATCRR